MVVAGLVVRALVIVVALALFHCDRVGVLIPYCNTDSTYIQVRFDKAPGMHSSLAFPVVPGRQVQTALWFSGLQVALMPQGLSMVQAFLQARFTQAW